MVNKNVMNRNNQAWKMIRILSSLKQKVTKKKQISRRAPWSIVVVSFLGTYEHMNDLSIVDACVFVFHPQIATPLVAA